MNLLFNSFLDETSGYILLICWMIFLKLKWDSRLYLIFQPGLSGKPGVTVLILVVEVYDKDLEPVQLEMTAKEIHRRRKSVIHSHVHVSEWDCNISVSALFSTKVPPFNSTGCFTAFIS